jgi:Na+(H+)/acetate symporter ActP
MRVVRITAVVCGLLGAVLGILLESVITALTIFYTLLSAALLLPLVAGLYAPRVTARTALVTLLAAVAATFILDRLTRGRGWWGVPPLLLATGLGLGVMILKTKFEIGKR